MSKRGAARPAELDRDLQRYAYRIAGPRDFAVNMVVNGACAWWIFGNQPTIPLTGDESIFKLLLPIAFLEATLTTLFGMLIGTRQRCKQNPSLVPLAPGPWLRTVIPESLVWGVAWLLFALGIRHWLSSAYPDTVLSLSEVVIIIGAFSGVLAYILHTRAVLRSSALFRVACVLWVAGSLLMADSSAVAAERAITISEGRRDNRGFLIHEVESPFQAGKTSIRVLAPDQPAAERCRVVYVLPVEPRDEQRYGDGLLEIKQHDLHNKHRVLFVAPTFSHLPWYADHPTNVEIRQESYLLQVVLPFVEKTYPVQAAPAGRLLAGFSKSGWGAWSLLLRHPDLFGRAAAWDAPLWKDRPDQFGMGEIFATQENFERYHVKSLLKQKADELRGKDRLVLTGYDNFRDQHQQTEQLLLELKIPHTYRDGPKRKHDWHSGWLEESLAFLLADGE